MERGGNQMETTTDANEGGCVSNEASSADPGEVSLARTEPDVAVEVEVVNRDPDSLFHLEEGPMAGVPREPRRAADAPGAAAARGLVIAAAVAPDVPPPPPPARRGGHRPT